MGYELKQFYCDMKESVTPYIPKLGVKDVGIHLCIDIDHSGDYFKL